MRIHNTFVTIVISIFIFLSCTTDNNPDFTLTTSSDPRESGIITPSQGDYLDGSEVEVSATANENMVFSGWRGDVMGSDNPSVITMNSNKTVIAFFIDREHPLNILVEGDGVVTESVIQEKSANFAHGTFVELTATPDEGWRLVEWRGNLSGSENPGVIKMDKAREVTAVFEKRDYPLSISIEGEGSVAEMVIQQKTTDYEHGTQVALTAHPADGWLFSRWGSDLDGNENPTNIIIDQEADITAIFKPVAELLAFTVQGEGTVDIEQIESDEYLSKNRVQLTARPNDGWKFNEWQGDVTGSDNPVQVTLIENFTVNAILFRSIILMPLLHPDGMTDRDLTRLVVLRTLLQEHLMETDSKSPD